MYVLRWAYHDSRGKQSRRVFKPREEWVIVPDSHPITMEQAEQVYQKTQHATVQPCRSESSIPVNGHPEVPTLWVQSVNEELHAQK